MAAAKDMMVLGNLYNVQYSHSHCGLFRLNRDGQAIFMEKCEFPILYLGFCTLKHLEKPGANPSSTLYSAIIKGSSVHRFLGDSTYLYVHDRFLHWYSHDTIYIGEDGSRCATNKRWIGGGFD